ncbi:uncharacterized protein LOC134189162 [Corticium candelabrum]|uniref:uncharacterized protein LOC134189162 n=1 Tax=Corticium candelabrum TaxID=121492 RepID=UPI002E26C89D|nr:uncharacterized protein LOC134189162 [Corticium candelabrum]
MASGETVNAMKTKSTSGRKQGNQGTEKQKCLNCGRFHKKGRNNCPATEQECWACGRAGHYEHMCRSSTKQEGRDKHKKKTETRVRQFEDEDTDDDEYERFMMITSTPSDEEVNTLKGEVCFKQQIHASMLVNGQPVKFQLDTGARCNVLWKLDVPAGIRVEATFQRLTLFN